mgnify:CR=1 FL=1
MAHPKVTVIGAGNVGATTAQRIAESGLADVVLVDVDLPGSDGIGLTADLVAFLPEVRVVVMSSVADRSTLRRANAAGASAFVPKDFPLEDMLAAIRSSRRGTMWTPSELDTHLKDLEETDSVDDGGLTPRELDVLRLLGEGRSVQQISRQLGISVHTTRGYVKAILAKLGVSSQLEAVLVATRRRIIARS